MAIGWRLLWAFYAKEVLFSFPMRARQIICCAPLATGAALAGHGYAAHNISRQRAPASWRHCQARRGNAGAERRAPRYEEARAEAGEPRRFLTFFIIR